MKKLLFGLAMFVSLITLANVPDTFYRQEGNTYVEYKAYDTGSGVIIQPTGYCAQSSSGTMRYQCNYQ